MLGELHCLKYLKGIDNENLTKILMVHSQVIYFSFYISNIALFSKIFCRVQQKNTLATKEKSCQTSVWELDVSWFLWLMFNFVNYRLGNFEQSRSWFQRPYVVHSLELDFRGPMSSAV